MTVSVTLTRAETSTAMAARPLDAHAGQQASGRPAEVLRLLGGHAEARQRAGRRRGPRGGWADAPRRRFVSAVAVASVGHAASSARQLRLDDLAVGLAGLEQLGVGAEPDGLAVLEHQDLVGVDDRRHPLGDDHHGGVGGVRRERGAQPGVGGQVERGERVVEEVDLRAGARAPGRWRGAGAGRPTRSEPPWAIGASSPPGMARTKSAAWAISRASHSARRWRRARRSAGCWRRCRRTGTASAARGRCGPTASRGRGRGRRRRRPAPCPTWRRTGAGTRLSSVVLPGPGAADDRGGLAGLGEE